MRMYYGWQDGKFVCLVQDDETGNLIARVSMKSDEANAVARSILYDSQGDNSQHLWQNHEQIV